MPFQGSRFHRFFIIKLFRPKRDAFLSSFILIVTYKNAGKGWPKVKRQSEPHSKKDKCFPETLENTSKKLRKTFGQTELRSSLKREADYSADFVLRVTRVALVAENPQKIIFFTIKWPMFRSGTDRKCRDFPRKNSDSLPPFSSADRKLHETPHYFMRDHLLQVNSTA